MSQLRAYLTELFDRITEMNNTDDTEYEDDFDGEAYQEDDTPDPEFVDEARGAEGYPRQNILVNPIMTTPRGGSRIGPSAPVAQQPSHEFAFQLDRPTRGMTYPMSDARDSRQMGEISPSTNLHGATSRLNAQITASAPILRSAHGHTQLIRSVADVLPVVETPISPPPSDVASNHSIGTNNSNGAGFFRVYHERPTMSVSPRGYGALTPDLNYAEIGHGRGAQPGPSDSGLVGRGSVAANTRIQHSSNHERTPRQPTIVPPHVTQETSHPSSSRGSSESSEYTDVNVRQNMPVDKTWSYHESSLTSPATRELQASVQSALGVERRGRRREQPESAQNTETERRARSVKRSIQNTFHAAEHYASSLLFGRNPEDTHFEGSMGSGSRTH